MLNKGNNRSRNEEKCKIVKYMVKKMINSNKYNRKNVLIYLNSSMFIKSQK